MAQAGASNLSGERIPLFDLFGVPKSSNIKEGYVVVFTSDSGDNKIVDIPTAATALLSGRAFAGINCDQGTTTAYTSTSPPGDVQIQVAVKGVAKCALKASTACTRGGEAAYDPVDGGPVVPYTSANQVKIGRFTQSKSSSASEQFVGVELDMGSDFAESLLGITIAAGTALSNTTTETSLGSHSISANRLGASKKLIIDGMVNVTGVNAGDKLIVATYLTASPFVAAASLKIGTTPTAGGGTAVNANDQIWLHYEVDCRTTTALIAQGYFAIGAIGSATMVPDGLQGSQAYVASVTNLVAVSGKWNNANASNSCKLESLSVRLVG